MSAAENLPILNVATGVGAFEPDQCPLVRIIGKLGDRSSLLVIRALAFTPSMTFKALVEETKMARATLTKTLKRLLDEGLIGKTPYRSEGERQREAYTLIEAGRALQGVLIAMIEWADAYATEPGWGTEIFRGFNPQGMQGKRNRRETLNRHYYEPVTIVRMPEEVLRLARRVHFTEVNPHAFRQAHSAWLIPNYYYNKQFVDPYIDVSTLPKERLHMSDGGRSNYLFKSIGTRNL
jgi:DNA-binding HxlR family transcriptional regulator